MQHVSVNPMMYYGSPSEPMNYNTTRDNTIPQQMFHVKTEKDSVGINTYNNGTNTFSQTENIRQYNMGSQTHPIKHVEFGVNTNSSNPDFSTQREPIDLSTQATNTPHFNEMTTQTRPLSFSTQTTNTPYFNIRPNSTQTTSTKNPRQTSTQTGPLNFSTTEPAKEEACQCEDNKSIQPFQSNFARQLRESEVMRRRPPLATDNRTHQQMGIELNEPRHQIDYNKRNSLQYTSPLIHKTPDSDHDGIVMQIILSSVCSVCCKFSYVSYKFQNMQIFFSERVLTNKYK